MTKGGGFAGWLRTLAMADLLRLRAIRSAVAGRSAKDSATVRQGHSTRVRQPRAVPRRIAADDDLISHLQRIPIPALAVQRARAGSLATPVCGVSLVILHVEVEIDVRIRPINLGDRAPKLDELAPVKFGGK